MIKKHIHHFNRVLVIGFKFLSILAIVAFASWLLLIVRLSQGPMNVDFLTRNIEQSLNSQQNGFEFDVGSTILTWGGTGQPFKFEMSHVLINRIDKTPVLSVEKIDVQLSKRYLFLGKFVPHVISIHDPALRIIRQENGQFMLNICKTATTTELTADNNDNLQTDFINSFLAQLNNTSLPVLLLGGLKQITIANAALLYEDKILHISWKSRKSDLTFTRERNGLTVNVVANIEQDQTHNAYVRGNFFYDWKKRKPNGMISFTAFNPSLMTQQSENLKVFSGINMPLKGSVFFEMDKKFTPKHGRFVLGSNSGTFNALGFYPKPLPIKSLYIHGQFDAETGEAWIEQLRADINGPKILGKAEIKRQKEDIALKVNVLLNNMPMDKLETYWPEKLTQNPRRWVTKHLSTGTATKSTLALEILAPKGDFNNMKLQKLGGQIDFNGIKVNYFPPMMPVTKVSGRATYDQKSFSIDINSGELSDMQMTKSKINITGIKTKNRKNPSKIDIKVSLNGPLRTALNILDGKPLQYTKKLGIKTKEVRGNTSVDVNFKFPLHKKLSLSEVKVTAKAKLDNVMLRNIVSDYTLYGGLMDLSVGNNLMTIAGNGRLGAMPVKFKWLKNFREGAEIPCIVEAKLPLNAKALAKFGIPDDFKIAGILPADITYTMAKNKTATLLFKGNITPTAFTIPIVDYKKLPRKPGTLDLLLHLKDDKPSRITNLNLTAKSALMRGNLNLKTDSNGQTSLKNASFNQIKLGNTDIALNADNSTDGYAIRIIGRQFDASKLLANDNTTSNNKSTATAKPIPPITVSMSVNRLLTGENKHIDQLKMFLRRNKWNRIEHMEVDGISGNKPIYLRYTPISGRHTLRFEAENAGAALSALDITDGVRGGKIIVTGLPYFGGGKRNLQGTVVLTDFSLINVPILGRLLNALSLPGIFNLLNSNGIAFKKMYSDFQWIDKGLPESAKNTRIIKTKNGRTSGASLGITFEGTIDNLTNMLDINGTIIPVSDLNKLLGIIPLVGDILTGGGNGIFAATYTVKGAKDKPYVAVNPLSVLAPGIFRTLFFEK
ncbi:MAG: hypothetical protein KAI76_04040 [Alphaproteobacteria bacterium]|nr:hypothetical protein [Alphaproteobacteria bacterium]